MKILHVIGSMNPLTGGPCQVIRNMIPELEKRVFQNEVVCFDNPSTPFLGTDAFIVYALGPGKGSWNYSSKFFPWLLQNLQRFDAVIIHGLWLYHSYAVSKAVRQLKKRGIKIPKLLVMPHGMLDPYFQKAPERKLKAIRNWVYWKLIEADVIETADALLFTSEEELRVARRTFQPYHPRKEVNVRFGIAEPPAFTTAMYDDFMKQCSELQHQPYFLFLSRIHDKKGVDLLVKGYEKMVSKSIKKVNVLAAASDETEEINETDFPDYTFPKLVIAGPGMSTPYGKEIQQMVAASKHLRKNVFFPGMLTGNAKWGAFYGCEAFVLPSHQENFGIAVVEALACGKPVMISDQVNIWPEIKTEGGGWVETDTKEGVFTMFEKWQRLSSEEKQKMNRQARKTYERFFTIEQNVSRLIEVIRS